MCKVKTIKTLIGVDPIVGERYNLDIICEISGKPITTSDKYGMFCEDMCELELHKEASNKLDALLDFVETLGIEPDYEEE